MEENRVTNAGQGFGIAGLVLGIIALIISFIPCLGMWALLPGVIAIIFSAIAYSQASRGNAARGLVIAALVISIVATAISGWQFYMLRNAPSHIEKLGKEIQKAIDENVDDEDLGKLEDAMEKLEGKMDEINEDSIEEASKAATEAVKEFSKKVQKTKKDLEKDKDEE